VEDNVNVQQQVPRLLKWFEALAALFALLVALTFSSQARAANYTDIWWNPSESGWGMTLSHHGDQIFGVWYIYDNDGSPMWVVMSDGTFSSDGRSFTGNVYRTSGPSYREAQFESSRVAVTQIGTARLDFDADDENATVTYSINQRQTVKRVTRQSFGNTPANFGADHSDLWWDPRESGWGLTLSHHGDQIFGVWYTYGDNGKPLWIVMPGGELTGNQFTGTLYTTSGSPYSANFLASQTKVTEVGSAKIIFNGGEAAFSTIVNGHRQVKNIKRQSFGRESGNKRPTIALALIPGATPLVAPASVTLRATPADSDGTVRKVTFFRGCEMIGEASAAPYELVVSNLAAGKYVFSARVTDNRGGVALATAEVVEVKTTGGGGGGTPTNIPPTVSITSPAANATFAPGASIEIVASAADSDGTVAKVEFYAGSTKVGTATASPWKATWANVAAGNYTLKAIATDDKGATKTSATVAIAVSGPAANKAPVVSITSPTANAQFAQGSPIDITATASDPDGTVAKVEFFADTTKVGEATASPWKATWANPMGGAYSLTAVATDDKGLTKTSTAVAIVVIGPAAAIDAPTRDAARFLTQATFGIHAVADIDALKAKGYETWLNEQFAMNANSHVQFVNDRKAAGEKADEERAYEAIWQQWLWEPAQLRARMSFALSEIFVVSNIAPDLDTYAMASYMDMLNRNAFGNYRQLLEDVTLHPTMGYYLNMQGSKKADLVKGTHPNENYAREVMQLFSIGLYKLNQDGSRMIVGGLPVSTYTQATVEAMAAAFSGWNFAGNDTSNAAIFNPAKENWLDPMLPWEMWHDTNAKTIFDGIVLPAGQNARTDMKGALDALANHPNVGPFIGRELIQRFVTSNPSPAYIGRVAAAFANNGSGVRGDLRATLRSVLMDPEARDLAKTAEPSWGKQREPVIRFANYLRALNATSPTGRNRIWYLDSADEGLNQSPLLSPSVFNFFSPNYRQPGPLSAANLVAPEFQITTETSMVGGLNFFSKLVRNGYYGSGDTRLTMNLTELNALANQPGALADRLNLLFMNGMMSDATRATIVSTLGAMALAKTGDSGSTVTDRVKAALILVSLAPDFVIQR
jgi:uncharacterized protein (DUF1800 family)